MKEIIIVALFNILLLHRCSAQNGNECEILGLPQTMQRGNIYFLDYNLPSVQLSLSCKCSIYQPFWQVYELEKPNLLERFPGDEKCMNTTSGQPCDDEEITYISERKPGIVLYSDATFTINQSKILMCYSSHIRQAVIVTLSDPSIDESIMVASTNTISTSSSLDMLFHSSSDLLYSATTTSTYIQSYLSAPSTSISTGSFSLMLSYITPTISQSTTVTHVVTTSTNSFQPAQATIDETRTVDESTVQGDTILKTVGTPTLVVLPMLLIALVINALLCILIIYIRWRHHNRNMEIKDWNLSVGHTQQGNSLERLIQSSTTSEQSIRKHSRNLKKSQSVLTYMNSHFTEPDESV